MEATILANLGDEPKLFSDCCVALSKPLILTLCERLHTSSVLSIGAGSGLLERLLLEYGVNIQAVEVLSCPNLYLPEERMLRVPTSSSLHSDAMIADVLLFCYPRAIGLVEQYLSTRGAVDRIVLLTHRDEWPGYEQLLLAHFTSVNEIPSSSSGLPVLAEYEVLCMASCPTSNGVRGVPKVMSISDMRSTSRDSK